MAEAHLSNEEVIGCDRHLLTAADFHTSSSRNSRGYLIHANRNNMALSISRRNDVCSSYPILRSQTYILPVTFSPDTPTKVADDPLWDLHPENPLPIIVRATNGKSKEKRADKVKLSTVVQPDALEAFYTRYVEVCKAGMQALKKRDRSKRKKDKTKKKKGGAAMERKG